MVWPSVFVLYTGYRYGWTPGVVGMTMMAGGVLGVTVQSFVVGPVIRRYGERGAMMAGAVAATLALAWYGLAPTGLGYWLGMPVSALGGLMTPGLQGLMTQCVGSDEQGQLQGANQSMAGLSSVIGPSLFGLSFSWAVRHPALHLPGLPLLLSALIMAACVALGARGARRSTAIQPS